MTGGEIADLVTAGVAVLGALAAWLRAQAAHARVTIVNNKVNAMRQQSPEDKM